MQPLLARWHICLQHRATWTARCWGAQPNESPNMSKAAPSSVFALITLLEDLGKAEGMASSEMAPE